MRKIYLDHGATTPIDKKVLAAMMPYLTENYGNAMSIHSFGQSANKAIEKARIQVADFFDAKIDEIIFTSGATESNNLVVKGIVAAHDKNNHPSTGEKPHIITTAFEHHCVLDACKILEKSAKAEVTYVTPNKEGIVAVKDIEKAIRPNTILVSVMYVNNEIGTVQSIVEIGKMLEKYPKIFFHTDATQAINYFNCNVKKLGVDLLSMSGHKIYGPKGIGVLYIKKGTPIARLQDGGGQEFGKRAGTHNVPGIVGIGAALTIIKSSKIQKQIKKLRDYLINRVLKEIPESRLNGSKKLRSPNNANFTFPRVEGESLIMLLDMDGIACSTGSACSSGNLEPSHVLMSLGMKAEDAHGSVRMTLGKSTTKKDIDYTIAKLKNSIKKVRKVSGNVLEDYYKSKKL